MEEVPENAGCLAGQIFDQKKLEITRDFFINTSLWRAQRQHFTKEDRGVTDRRSKR